MDFEPPVSEVFDSSSSRRDREHFHVPDAPVVTPAAAKKITVGVGDSSDKFLYISTISFGLGILFSLGFLTFVIGGFRSIWWATYQLGFFSAAWATFHFGEFTTTAGWNPDKCTVDCE